MLHSFDSGLIRDADVAYSGKFNVDENQSSDQEICNMHAKTDLLDVYHEFTAHRGKKKVNIDAFTTTNFSTQESAKKIDSFYLVKATSFNKDILEYDPCLYTCENYYFTYVLHLSGLKFKFVPEITGCKYYTGKDKNHATTISHFQDAQYKMKLRLCGLINLSTFFCSETKSNNTLANKSKIIIYRIYFFLRRNLIKPIWKIF